jgi:hypothetical protein
MPCPPADSSAAGFFVVERRAGSSTEAWSGDRTPPPKITDKTDNPPAGSTSAGVLSVLSVIPEREKTPKHANSATPFRAWRLRNAELLAEQDGRLGHDVGGFCAAYHRPLSYPEQQRGACSWCVPVDPEQEPENWASHWRRFTEGR